MILCGCREGLAVGGTGSRGDNQCLECLDVSYWIYFSSLSKLLQNGKLNGNAVNKNIAVPSGKKKDTSEKHSPPGKAVTPEKSSAVEKKASKKSRAQNEKKTVVEKKKESISNDDMNDGEWVQLVSKKGRKNRKKDEVLTAEKQPDTSKSNKMTDVNKSDESNAEELPKKSEAIATDSDAVDQKQDSELENEKNVQSSADLISVSEKPKIQDVAEETIHLEKELPKESITKESKALEEGNKTKKKKKKNVESIHPEKDPVTSISDSPAVQVIPEISSSQDNSASNVVNASEHPKVTSGKAESEQTSTSKSSNVVFDELEGLYPEAKDQKKKKRVRRDH
ncbi:triadin-like [Stegodyphus dumicola]|uniref:triadin-like n=1 Tax=Stegodyphus dumicola TaxID=202533 RepID=UPI0015B2D18A|nr:triadin-like [Stegodyphus dumicola]